jgi:hypothetical protein
LIRLNVVATCPIMLGDAGMHLMTRQVNAHFMQRRFEPRSGDCTRESRLSVLGNRPTAVRCYGGPEAVQPP